MEWDDFIAEYTETAPDGYVAAQDILVNLDPDCEVYERTEAFLAVAREYEDFLTQNGYTFAHA